MYIHLYSTSMTTFTTYKDYKAVDFIVDESFLKYVRSGMESDQEFWQQLVVLYPVLQREMDIAIVWMKLIREQEIYKSKLDNNERWNRLQQAIPKYDRKQKRLATLRTVGKWTARVAAVIIMVLFLQELSQFGSKSAKTSFGQKRTFILPDSSKIYLNSNSKISYIRGWKTDKPREIWMDGEALFEVKHTAIKNRLRDNDFFIVHVGDLSLTVLGTRFNVKKRRQKTAITLLEGRIRIEGPDGLKKILAPGETFVYDKSNETQKLIQNEASKISSWIENEMDVEHSSLADLIEILEDNYGYTVQLQDPDLLEKRLSGTIPIRHVNDIIFVIRHTMNVNIQSRGRQIIIQSKTTN